MSNIIIETGYPAYFHLGFPIFIWLIFILIMLIFGTSFFIKGYKTKLLNQKELYIGNGMTMYGFFFTFFFIQLGALFPAIFIILLSASSLSLLGFNTLFIYYFEKNLVNLNKIPTIYSVFASIISLLNLLYAIINGTMINEFFGIVSVILIMIQMFYVFILIVVFIKRTIGVLRTTGYIWIISYFLFSNGGFFEHPPLVSLLPDVFALITPTIFIIGGILWFYSNKILVNSILSYYNQAHICTVHRGTIPKGEPIHYCSSCNTIYCQNCYKQVIKKEGCWNCGIGSSEILESIPDRIWEDEELILENESKDKIKGNKVPK
jgi:hypothetical protein